MKRSAITIVVLLAGNISRAELNPAIAQPAQSGQKVTVCMAARDPRLPPGTLAISEALAGRIFKEIGVTLDWVHYTANCRPNGLVIGLSMKTPKHLKPGAMAYALPVEGVHIEVFYDRIARSTDRMRTATILGHVFAHEIAHILQGVSRHSETGIMKAHWTRMDMAAMSGEPLGFEKQDIEWIALGLARRVSVAQASRTASRVEAAVVAE